MSVMHIDCKWIDRWMNPIDGWINVRLESTWLLDTTVRMNQWWLAGSWRRRSASYRNAYTIALEMSAATDVEMDTWQVRGDVKVRMLRGVFVLSWSSRYYPKALGDFISTRLVITYRLITENANRILFPVKVIIIIIIINIVLIQTQWHWHNIQVL